MVFGPNGWVARVVVEFVGFVEVYRVRGLSRAAEMGRAGAAALGVVGRRSQETGVRESV